MGGLPPTGLEPEIIRSLAEQLNADIRWYWDSENDLLAALKHRELDVVIGGLTKGTRLSGLAAPTKPYYQSRYTVGVPSGSELPGSLEGLEVAVPPVNHIRTLLEDEGARPEKVANILNADNAVAAPTWWLSAHDFLVGPWEIATDQHVMALAKGENAWMLKVQRHLSDYPHIGQRLQQLEVSQ